MARRRHTPEQIIRKLREGEKLLSEGKDLAEVCKHLEISVTLTDDEYTGVVRIDRGVSHGAEQVLWLAPGSPAGAVQVVQELLDSDAFDVADRFPACPHHATHLLEIRNLGRQLHWCCPEYNRSVAEFGSLSTVLRSR